MPDRIDNLVDQQRIDAQFAHISKLIDELVKKITNLNSLAGQFNIGGGGRGGSGGGGGRGTSNQARTELEQLIAAQERLTRSTTAAAQLIAQYNYQTNQQSRANRNAAAAATNHASSLNGMRARLSQLTQQYDNYDRAQRRSRNEGRLTLQQIQALQREISQLERQTGRFGRNVGNYPKLVGGITGFLGAFGLATGAVAIGKEIFDTTVQLDSLNAGLKAVSKTEKEFAVNQTFLTDLSDRLGIKVIDLTQAYKLFYAASTEAGLSAKSTRQIFSSVAEVSANLKLSQEDTNGVLLAFSQILGKGKVQAEELRGQIGERVPGAFSIAARSIGVTEQQLNKMLEKGEVIASEFLPKFAAELEKTFGVDNQEHVEGVQASINRLSNSFTKMIGDNEGGLSIFFGKIIDLARGALEAINNLTAGISYVSLKFTDSAAAGKFLNTKAVDDYKKDIQNLPVNALLELSTNVNKNLKFAQNRVNGTMQDIALANKIGGAEAARNLKLYNETLKQQQVEVDLLTKTRDAINSTIDKKLPGGEDLNEPSKSTKKPATEKELNAAAKLRELRIKANADNLRAELQDEIANQKEIVDSDNRSLSERLIANKEYYRLKNQLAKVDADAEKGRIQEEIDRGRAVPEQLTAIERKYSKELGDNTRENSKNITKIILDNADERTKAIVNRYAQESEIIESNQNIELEKVQSFYQKGLITKEQYEDEKLRIDNKYAILQLQNELALQEEILEISKKYADPAKVAEIESKIKDIRNKIRDLDLKYFDDTEKKKTEREKEEQRKREELRRKEIDMVKQLARESVDSLFSIFDAQFENQKNMVQDQMDQLDKKTQKEIEAVNASTDSEQSKANKIAIINARAAAQKEQLERRQRQIDQEKARFDRLKSIGEIIAGTAVNIVKVFPNPVLIALAAAIGAAQLGQVLASPIPRYRDGAGVKGRPSHKGGLAQVNDGGKLEVIESPTGNAYVAKGMNAIVDMPGGYKVHPSISDYYAASSASAFKPIPVVDSGAMGSAQIVGHITAQYKQQTAQLLAGMEKYKSIMIVKNTWGGLQASQKHASGLTNYLNRNVHN